MTICPSKHNRRVWAFETSKTKEKTDTTFVINKLKVLQKSVKLISFLILIITFVIVAVGCFGQYFEEKTYMDTFVVSQKNALFPAITICPITAGYKKDVFKVGNFS